MSNFKLNISNHNLVDFIDDDREIFGDLVITLVPGYIFSNGEHSKSFDDEQQALTACDTEVIKCDCSNCLNLINSRNLKPFDFKVTLCFDKYVSVNANSYEDAVILLKKRISETDNFTAINSNMDYFVIRHDNNIVDFH